MSAKGWKGVAPSHRASRQGGDRRVTQWDDAASADAFTRRLTRGAFVVFAAVLFWLWTPNAWAESAALQPTVGDSTAVVTDAEEESPAPGTEVSGDLAVDEPTSATEEPAPVDGAPEPEAPPPETVETPTPIEPEGPAAESPPAVAVPPSTEVPPPVAAPPVDVAPPAEQPLGPPASLPYAGDGLAPDPVRRDPARPSFYTGGGLIGLSSYRVAATTLLEPLAWQAPGTSDRKPSRTAGDREGADPRHISPPSLDRSESVLTGTAGSAAGASGGSGSGLVAVLVVVLVVAAGRLGQLVSVSVRAPCGTRLILEVERPG
jgi:outer membrane biosynthesis protein TonB